MQMAPVWQVNALQRLFASYVDGGPAAYVKIKDTVGIYALGHSCCVIVLTYRYLKVIHRLQLRITLQLSTYRTGN